MGRSTDLPLLDHSIILHKGTDDSAFPSSRSESPGSATSDVLPPLGQDDLGAQQRYFWRLPAEIFAIDSGSRLPQGGRKKEGEDRRYYIWVEVVRGGFYHCSHRELYMCVCRSVGASREEATELANLESLDGEGWHAFLAQFPGRLCEGVAGKLTGFRRRDALNIVISSPKDEIICRLLARFREPQGLARSPVAQDFECILGPVLCCAFFVFEGQEPERLAQQVARNELNRAGATGYDQLEQMVVEYIRNMVALEDLGKLLCYIFPNRGMRSDAGCEIRNYIQTHPGGIGYVMLCLSECVRVPNEETRFDTFVRALRG
ncbi:MAG: hypothetical protein LBD72_01880 [Puniceicoccales bacterium]|nr:hypothetical protein [Puniceicoccales bacterium]